MICLYTPVASLDHIVLLEVTADSLVMQSVAHASQVRINVLFFHQLQCDVASCHSVQPLANAMTIMR